MHALNDDSKRGVLYTSTCAFLFSAIALITPSGYSYGAALLFLGSLPVLCNRALWPRLSADDLSLLAVLIFFVGIWFVEIILTGQSVREFDKPSRFIFAMAALILLLRFPPRPSFVWSGIAVGALGAGCWSAWQKFFLSVDRAGGYTHLIQYGNISMLLGILCLAGLGWALKQPRSKTWLALMLLGFLAGFLSSMLSGSRGGWIGLPFVALVLYKVYRPWLNHRLILATMTGATLLIGAIYLIPATGVQARVLHAVQDIVEYQHGNAHSSLGLRFEMWKGASQLFLEKPLIGWGVSGYIQRMGELADTGVIAEPARQFTHAHNEYLDVAAKRGLVGLISLLLLYFWPLKLFLKAAARTSDLSIQAYAAAGSLLCVAFIDFSLSQAFLSHNSGVMIYAFMLVILWTQKSSHARNRNSP